MPSSNPKRTSASAADTASVAHKAFVCAALLAHGIPAAAQDKSNGALHGLSGSVGVGTVATMTYEGSSNRRVLVGPDFSFSYRTRDWGGVELGQRGLVWQPVESGDFRLGLTVGIDPGRKTTESSSSNPTPGDRRLVGLGVVRASAEAGLLVGYGSIGLLAHRSVGGRGHQGTQADLYAEFPMALTDAVGIRFGLGATWADRRYMQTFFGVTPGQAQTSGFQPYTPKAGLRKFEASVGAEYAFVKDWRLRGTLVLTRLSGDAEDSPLVARKSYPSASLGFACVF